MAPAFYAQRKSHSLILPMLIISQCQSIPGHLHRATEWLLDRRMEKWLQGIWLNSVFKRQELSNWLSTDHSKAPHHRSVVYRLKHRTIWKSAQEQLDNILEDHNKSYSRPLEAASYRPFDGNRSKRNTNNINASWTWSHACADRFHV